MKSKRKDPNLTEKLAAFVLTMRVQDEETGELVPFIDRAAAKQMTAAQLVSLVNFDHHPMRVERALELGLPPEEYNHPTNLDPLPIMAHRVKTATKDIPEIAKGERLSTAQEEFRQRMLAKSGQAEAPPERPRKGKPMPGGRASPYKHRMNGQWVRR